MLSTPSISLSGSQEAFLLAVASVMALLRSNSCAVIRHLEPTLVIEELMVYWAANSRPISIWQARS